MQSRAVCPRARAHHAVHPVRRQVQRAEKGAKRYGKRAERIYAAGAPARTPGDHPPRRRGGGILRLLQGGRLRRVGTALEHGQPRRGAGLPVAAGALPPAGHLALCAGRGGRGRRGRRGAGRVRRDRPAGGGLPDVPGGAVPRGGLHGRHLRRRARDGPLRPVRHRHGMGRRKPAHPAGAARGTRVYRAARGAAKIKQNLGEDQTALACAGAAFHAIIQPSETS